MSDFVTVQDPLDVKSLNLASIDAKKFSVIAVIALRKWRMTSNGSSPVRKE